MRIIATLLAILFSTSALAEDYIIHESIPEIAGITKDTTFGSLKKDLKIKATVEKAGVYVGEGYCEPGVIVGKGTSHEFSVHFDWDINSEYQYFCDDKPTVNLTNDTKVSGVRIAYKTATAWKTESGLSIGSNLIEIEKLYGPVKFSGFGWDYGGGCCFEDEENKVKNLNFSLDQDEGNVTENLLGDKSIDSKDLSDEIKKKVKIQQISLSLGYVE